MNIRQVKERYSMQGLLEALGHSPDPKKSRGHDLWYNSPFRPGEGEPSFHIHAQHNIWKDFGLADRSGGDMLAFVQRLLEEQGRAHSISDVLEWFRNLSGVIVAEPSNQAPQRSPVAKPEVLKLLSVKPVFSKALFDYLTERGIDRQIGTEYLKQVYFEHLPTSRKMYGLGFLNRSGGYEVRNSLGFKGVVGPKDISLVEAQPNSSTLEVFEGTFDFATYMTLHKRAGHSKPEHDCIILHSTALCQAAIQLIKEKQYKTVSLWLDNDEAGEKARGLFREQLGVVGVEVVYRQEGYAGFKDLNEWHLGNRPQVWNKVG